MNYELRILSGLHRGAAMPLDDESLTIGASEHADVVLVDPDIEEQHAKLSRTDNGWVVLAESGDLYSPDGPNSQKLVDVEPGGFVRVGQVWMTIAEEGAAWVSPPPDPPSTILDDTIDFAESDESMPIAQEEEADAEAEQAVAAENNALAAESSPNDEEGAKPSAGGGAVRRVLAAPLAVIAVLSGAAAYAITARSPEPAEPTVQKKPDIHSDLKAKARNPDDATPSAKANAEGHKAAQRGGGKLSPEELRQAFRKRMSDADLLKRFEFDLRDDSWSMRADLDHAETARFERVLKGFMDEHRITFPVNAKVVSADEMLPFKIRQVISGNHASIVTDDGSRLYVGDEYLGVRVVSINGNKLVFAGKRKIEVVW